MSVDLSNEDIFHAYETITNNTPTNWLLLRYSTRDKLFLHATGSGGVSELRQHLVNDDVFFGFIRERDYRDNRDHFALLLLVPEAVSGVRRARALVHSRAVGSLFKAHQVTLHCESLSQVTTSSVRARLDLEIEERPRVAPLNIQRPIPNKSPVPPPSPRSPLRSPQSPTRIHPELKLNTEQPPRLATVTPPPKSPKRSQMTQLNDVPPMPSQHHIATLHDVDIPPPTPPKPRLPPLGTPHLKYVSENSPLTMSPSRRAFSENNTVRTTPSNDAFLKANSSLNTKPRSASAFTKPQYEAMPEDPVVLARRREELRRLREEEERENERAEQEAALRARLIRAQQQKEELLHEEQRKQMEVEEIRRKIAERQRREEQRREEERVEALERERRRLEDKQRRIQAARLAEERRTIVRRKSEAADLREKEKRARLKEAQKQKLLEVQKQYQAKMSGRGLLMSGYVTVQISETGVWKRRFFDLTPTGMTFYRSETEKDRPIINIGIQEEVAALKEWDEGFEELESVPHSFAMTFKDDGPPWLFFSDAASDKERLLGLLNASAGLLTQ